MRIRVTLKVLFWQNYRLVEASFMRDAQDKLFCKYCSFYILRMCIIYFDSISYKCSSICNNITLIILQVTYWNSWHFSVPHHSCCNYWYKPSWSYIWFGNIQNVVVAVSLAEYICEIKNVFFIWPLMCKPKKTHFNNNCDALNYILCTSVYEKYRKIGNIV
jgi:hypothetical protein